ncbi:MAG: T9SS type A sorting domain-containing protein [Bacteroidales bacterium]|nr:T9SS type A sorting domain-containing protein [Bacteroidales bacterium]
MRTNGESTMHYTLKDHQGNQARIDLSPMAKGIYMMHIEANGGQTVRKIVVE